MTIRSTNTPRIRCIHAWPQMIDKMFLFQMWMHILAKFLQAAACCSSCFPFVCTQRCSYLPPTLSYTRHKGLLALCKVAGVSACQTRHLLQVLPLVVAQDP